MQLRMPRYFRQFHCAGGECPDTCCRDWAVVLDEETSVYYLTVPGKLGEDLRSAMALVDGDLCLNLKDGFCPMLTEDRLCRLQLELGERHLCPTCQQHPRFAEEYGSLQEWSLSMACPEAVRLMLADSSPMTFEEEKNSQPVSGYNTINPNLYFALLKARKTAMKLIQDRSCPWQARLSALLSFAVALQRRLNRHRIGELNEVSQRFEAGRGRRLQPNPIPAAVLLERLSGLDAINRDWIALLEEARSVPTEDREQFAAASAAWDYEYEHLMVYYVFRYFLKAVNDRQILHRMQLAAVGVLTVRALEAARWQKTGALTEAERIDFIHRYSREVEHSEDNVRTLFQWFREDPLFAPERLAGE